MKADHLLSVNPTMAVRLWSKVDRSGGPDSCWPYSGYTNDRGYGTIGNKPHRQCLAHRAAFIVSGGVLTPERPCVLHRCDNPPCCNPIHLFAGNNAENMADMFAKGRAPVGAKHGTHTKPHRHNSRLHPELRQGENHGGHILTAFQVLTIRDEWSKDTGRLYGKAAKLGRKYGVASCTISAIISGRLWRHLLQPGEDVIA